MIGEGVIKWIVDFLKARKYRVIVNGSYSGWHNVTSGIPQGSVFGTNSVFNLYKRPRGLLWPLLSYVYLSCR